MRTHYGPWQPCWISNQHQKHKSGRGPSSEHFWQVWLISVQRFQRRRFKCEKLTDGRTTDAYPWQKLTWPMTRWAKKSANQKQELPVAGMFVNRSGKNEQSLERTFHRCFLPSFSSFGLEVSEDKIKIWKVNGRRTPSDGKSSHCLWQGELKMLRTIQVTCLPSLVPLVSWIFDKKN